MNRWIMGEETETFLVVRITVLSLILIHGFSTFCLGQSKKEITQEDHSFSKDDEARIKKGYEHQLNNSKPLGAETLDSTPYETGSWEADSVFFSKDSSFKVFNFSGDYTEAGKAVHEETSIIQLQSGKVIDLGHPASQFFQTGHNTYLVIGNKFYGGSFGGHHFEAYQFSIVNETVVEVPFFQTGLFDGFAEQIEMTGKSQFSVFAPWYYVKETYLRYDEENGVLSYQMVRDNHTYWPDVLFSPLPDEELELDENEIIKVMGTLTIQEGKVSEHEIKWEKAVRDEK